MVDMILFIYVEFYIFICVCLLVPLNLLTNTHALP